jgi:2-polyprenyl-3-methyl-5-hydroxy-6-metoxy-1,4-benzoquinol methylase
MLRGLRKSRDPAVDANAPEWDDPFEHLRRKWSEVPSATDRVRSPELLALSDTELVSRWDEWLAAVLEGDPSRSRLWWEILYAPLLMGARVMDFGSGLGFDGIRFAKYAESVTFVDIAASNLEVIKRVARAKGLTNTEFKLIESFESFGSLDGDYDVVFAIGSLHHAPQRVVRREIDELATRLKVGGRWLQLAYPRERWVREGRLPFSRWGESTDGIGTPWAEWYDASKLLDLFEPREFEVVVTFNWHDDDFNWFDLIRRS